MKRNVHRTKRRQPKHSKLKQYAKHRRPLVEILEGRQMLATDLLQQLPSGTVGENVRWIDLTFSEALLGESARTQSNYQLTHLGADGQVGGNDDQVYSVLPQYIDGSTMLRLSALADLSQWTEVDYGFPAGIHGEWQLNPAHGSVLQTINGAATFFVSGSDSLNQEFAAQVQVTQDFDDDYIGLVFGFKTNADTGLPDSYYLLSWKRETTGAAAAGFKLARVSGTGQINERPDLWSIGENDPHIDVLSTGPTVGWTPETPYEFRIARQPNGIISVDVIDKTNGDHLWTTQSTDPNPLGPGRVGFFNFSQPHVEHWVPRTTGSLPSGKYQLRINGGGDGLRDANGIIIDGDHDGDAGGDYVSTFTIDIGVATVGIDLQSASDTGVSASDDRTRIETPTFDLTTNRSGLVEVFIDNGLAPVASIPFLAAETKAWTSAQLDDGSHSIRVQFTPDLGNSVSATLPVVVDTVGPSLLPGSATAQAPVYDRSLQFDEAIDENNPGLNSLVSLTDPDQIPVSVSVMSIGNGAFSVGFSPLLKPGLHTLTANPAIVDLAGNPLRAVAGQSTFTVLADTTLPVLVDYSPNTLVKRTVDRILVKFSEDMRPDSFTAQDVVIIGPAGVTIPTITGVSPIAGSLREFEILLATSLATDGPYQFTVGPNIADLSGNTLAAAVVGSFSIKMPLPLPAGPGDGVFIELFNGIGGGSAPTPQALDGRSPDGTTLSPEIDFPRPGSVINVGNSFTSFFAGTTTPPDEVAQLAALNFILRHTFYVAISADMDRNPATPEIDVQFGVGSDDGFHLTIDDRFLGATGDRGFNFSWFNFSVESSGLYPVSLLFAANAVGQSGLEFWWNTAKSGGNQLVPQQYLYVTPVLGDQTITFEELPQGTVVTDQFRDRGILFQTLSGDPRVTNAFPGEFVPVSPTNVFADPADTPEAVGEVEFRFVVPGTNDAATTNFLSLYLIDTEDVGSTVTAWDPEGNVLFNQTVHGGGASQQRVVIQRDRIARVGVTLGQGTDTAAIDNLTFNTPTTLNSRPQIQPIADLAADEGTPISFTVMATDPDLATQSLSYALAPGAPSGASLNPVTGVFSWIPSENQGPGANPFTIVVLDNGSPRLRAEESFVITVNETNRPPQVAPISDKVLRLETPTLQFQIHASDEDRPIQSLTYSLLPGAPAWATIDPQTGLFSAAIDGAVLDGAYPITVRVEDNGLGNLSATTTFSIVVDNNRPNLIAQAIAPSGALQSGTAFNLSWQVANTGSETAVGPWVERVYISNSADGSNRQLLGSFEFTASLGPTDAPIDRLLQVTLPQTSLNGQVFFVVEVDATNNIAETDESNLFVSTTSYAIPAALFLAPSAGTVSENGAAAVVTLARNGDVSLPLVITLGTSIPGQLSLPATVTIPAGQYSQRFDVGAAADGLLDGNATVIVTATAPGFVAASSIIQAIDTDRGELTLTAPSLSLLEGGSVLVTLSRAMATNQPLLVSLATSASGQLALPTSVVIPANETSAQFTLQTVNDSLAEKTEAIGITASATGYDPAALTFQISDDDLPILSITLDRSSILENDASHPMVATVRRQTVSDVDLRVKLTSSDISEAIVPSEIVIPAGQATTTFLITPVNDSLLDGIQDVIIKAFGTYASCGCTITTGFGEATAQVLDDESPALSIDIDNVVVREGVIAAGQITITRNTATTGLVSVTLTSGNPTKLLLPATADIPDGQASVTVPFSTASDGVTNGDEQILITAQATGLATASRTITVTDRDLPDLVVATLNAPPTGLTGDSVNVSWTTANAGHAPANGTWTERILISSDNAVGDDLLVGQYTFTGPVNAGQSYGRTAQFQLPTVPGNYWIIVQADVGDAVREGSDANNAYVSASPIGVSAAYSASVMTDVEMAPANTPILLRGSATRTNGLPATFQQVNVHLKVRGTERVLPAITDADGNFQLTFTPLPGEGGNYTVGATHPGLPDAPAQDSFKLVGMRAEPPSDAIEVKEGDSHLAKSLQLRNLADVPLTNLSVEVLGAPPNLVVAASLAGSTNTLPAMGTLKLDYTLAATDPTVQSGTFRLRITSLEAPPVEVPVSFRVIPLVSRLTANPGVLNKTMLVGDQTSVEFTVTNTGGLATGPLTVLLPSGADWLSLATAATVPSLGAGESTAITLLLTPRADLPLTAYSGSLVVRGETAQAEVPFSFRAVSEEVGSLEITVVDEFFYFAEDKPLVANATVTLRDAITGAEIISSNDVPQGGGPDGGGADSSPTVSIDTEGRIKFSGIPEGPYTLEVRADDHETYSNVVRVEGGQSSSQQVFVSKNLVTYIWTVEEVEIEDRTRITIEAVFETNVPAPVVTVEGVIDLADLQVVGQTQQFNIKLTNHGLIAANDVTLDFGEHPFYQITPLVRDIGVLPAKSEIVVPVVVTRIGDFEEGTSATDRGRGSGIEALGAMDGAGDEGPAGGGADSSNVPCIIVACAGWTYICGVPIPKCTIIPVTNVEGNCPPGTGYSPGGSVGPVGPGDSRPDRVTPVEVGRTRDCPECLGPTAIACAIGFVPVVGNIASCAISLGTAGDWISVGAATVGCFAPPGWSCVIGFLDCLRQALNEPPNASESEGNNTSESDEEVVAEASFAPIWGDEFVAAFDALDAFFKVIYGPGKWFDSLSGSDEASWRQRFGEAIGGDSPGGPNITASERSDLIAGILPEGVSAERAGQFLDRWQRTGDYWSAGIFNVEDVPNGMNTDFIAVDSYDSAAAVLKQKYDELIATGIVGSTAGDGAGDGGPADGFDPALFGPANASGDGVCAQVRIQIEQTAVLTRQGFLATLGVANPSDNGPLTQLKVDVLITDAAGRVVNNLFSIQPQFTASPTGVDVPSGATRELSWLIVPTDRAAPTENTTYYVGGRFQYLDSGIPVAIELAEDAITVVPQPALELDYFLQRDVISDDPHTIETERAEPFTLAVMVQNNGAGVARDLRIESAQPKIVENEKGLLIDFEITGTKVNGGDVTKSLTATFGDVSAGQIAIAEWQMESTLQGLFVDYNASFEHLSGLGDTRLSLIKSVEIHELIHTVHANQLADGDDGLPDFLVNELADPQDLPDTLFLSDGSVATVGLGLNATVDSPPVLSDLRVQVSATMAAGWSYLRMNDPSNGDFQLVGIQRSDGTMLPVENFWQTDRTFVGGGQRPVLEDKIHLLDYNSTGTYTFIFSNGDLTGPNVTGFAGVVPNPTTQAIDIVDITFSERLADASFTGADLALTRNGAVVALSGLSIAFVSGSTYRVSGLAAFTGDDAVYELTVKLADLTDQVGNPGVGTSSYRWVKGETAPTVLQLIGAPSGAITTSVESIDVVFSKLIDLSTLSIADFLLTRGTTNLLDEVVTISQVGTSTYRIGNLGRLTGTDGAYQFAINAAGVQDNLGNAGLGSAQAAWTLDKTAPLLQDVVDPTTNPRNIVVQQIDLVFSEPIDINSLDIGDLQLVRNSGVENLIAGDSRVTFQDRGNNVYRIQGINWVQAFVANPQVASFALTVDARGIKDIAGNTGVGVLSSTWTIDLDKPAAATSMVLSTFSGPVVGGLLNSRSATLTGQLGEAGLTVAVLDMATGEELGRETFAATAFAMPITFPSFGQHRLRVRTIDPAGNTTDTFIENLFVRETPPVIESIVGVPGAFTNGPVSMIEVKFVEAIDPTTFKRAAIAIRRNGGINLVDENVTIEPQAGNRTFLIKGLAGVTSGEGVYELSIDLDEVTNSAGLSSTEQISRRWTTDRKAPTSSIRNLALRQELNTFVIDLIGNDPALAGGFTASGIESFELYFSKDGAPFELWSNIAAGTPTTTFVAEPNHVYYFRSLARDTAGNTESKPVLVDAWTFVPDLLPPLTQVDSVDATDATFEIAFSGTDLGLNLRAFDLYVEIDDSKPQLVGRFAADGPDEMGIYHGTAEFQAIADGFAHQYRFFTVGMDRGRNVEQEPENPSDVVVTASFATPAQTEIVDFDVQRGADQRSYIRYLDVTFNRSSELAAIVASLADSNSANDRVRLRRYGLDGSGSGDLVDLTGRITALDQALAIDFGAEGIGGDRLASVGDGYYSLEFDLNGDGIWDVDRAFYRLLGDTDRDGDADDADLAAINAAFGQIGENLDSDINGDGRVNMLDRQLWQRSRGKRLASGLHLDD